MRHRLALLVSLALAGSLLLAAAPTQQASSPPAPHPPACAREADGEADWGTVSVGDTDSDDGLPTTPGNDQIIDVWVDRWSAADIAVTDGRVIQVSHDAGCSFTTTFRLDESLEPGADVQPATSHIVAIEGGDHPDDDHLVAVIADLDTTSFVSARLRTLVSSDRGDTWQFAGTGLPEVELAQFDRRCGPQSFLCQLRVAAFTPQRVYLTIPAVSGAQLWVSDDHGLTFEQHYRALPGLGVGETGTQPELDDFVIDRLDPNLVWAVDRSGLSFSSDAGRTWGALGNLAGLPSFLRLAAVRRGTDVVVAVVTDGPDDPPLLHRSLDGGRTFATMPLDVDGQVTALAPGDDGRGLVFADEASVGRLDPATGLVTRFGGSSLLPVRHPHVVHATRLIWFATDFGLAVHGDASFLPPIASAPGDLELPAFDPAKPRGQVPGELRTATTGVELDPGESIEVPMELVVPPAPTPLDIFFLFDESGSMRDEMDALARGARDIVNRLRLRGLDVNVGLGGYANAYRYQRYRQIGPADDEFLIELRQLGRNGSDANEYAFTALHQLATGTGLANTGYGLAPRKGHDARWRPGAVRLVIHLGDEQLKGAPGDPGQAEATQALIDERIYHLALVSEAEAKVQLEGAREGLSPVATPWRDITRATGAVAGPSGVDCNGDGIAEIPEGGEIVCFMPEVGTTDQFDEQVEALPDMASVVVEIVSAVSEFHELTFHTDRPELVSLDTGTDGPILLDIRNRIRVPVTATVTCSEAFDGTTSDATVTAVAAARHLAATTLRIACGTPLTPAAAVAASVPPVVAVVVQPGAAVVVQPGAAPAPPSPANPAATGSQATSQAASQATAPSAQGAAGAVKQKSAQAQAAMAGGATGQTQGEDEAEYLLPATRRRSDHTGVTLGAGAVMSLGFGVALMRRERTRTAVRRRWV